MSKYRKILVAVDGSDTSRNAFRQACRVARDDKSWITVITAVPVFQDQFDVLSMKEKVTRTLLEEGEKILAGIIRTAKEEDTVIRTMLKEGSPFEVILDAAEDNNFDLIVMGRRGMSHIERTLVGSVTAGVIAHSRRDVLIVPKDAGLGWKNILLPTDGSKYSGFASEKAMELAASYGGSLMVVSVVDVTDEFSAQAPDAVEELVVKAKRYTEDIGKRADGINFTALVREGETYKVITKLAGDAKSDIIVMGSHGRTGVRRFFIGNVTEKVIGYAPCPVLIVKESR
ncbi:MAG: universal stress protein [Nitrospiraceae bacterium]|nr:MAG: universal stress protein [Nitrospiraceae bacterium]